MEEKKISSVENSLSLSYALLGGAAEEKWVEIGGSLPECSPPLSIPESPPTHPE